MKKVFFLIAVLSVFSVPEILFAKENIGNLADQKFKAESESISKLDEDNADSSWEEKKVIPRSENEDNKENNVEYNEFGIEIGAGVYGEDISKLSEEELQYIPEAWREGNFESEHPVTESNNRSTLMRAVYPNVNNYIHNHNLIAANIRYEHINHFTKFNYRNGLGAVEGIVAHETANNSSNITQEISYMSRNHKNAFVHAFVDHNHIIEIHPTNLGAWGAGRYANQRFVHVELVRVHSFDQFARSINNYSDYIAEILYTYNLGVSSAERTGMGSLWSHKAVSNFLGGTNHVDPHGYFEQWGYSWNEFVNLVTIKYDKLDIEASGVYWDGKEMGKGQIGRIQVTKPLNLWKRDANNNLSFVRILQPGEQLRVFAYDSLHGGQYKVGETTWVTEIAGYMKYETPSKSLLDRLNNNAPKNPVESETVKGTGTGVFWDKVEMALGQIGRIQVTKPLNLWKRDANNNLSFVRILQPGEQLRAFAYDSLYGGQYKVGEDIWVTQMTGYMKYETPSKSLLDKLNNANPKDPTESEAIKGTGTGVFWDKVEMALGQIGRIQVAKSINLWKRDENNNLSFVRVLSPGEQLRVYEYDNLYGGQYRVGDNMWVTRMVGHIRYETPSKKLLDELNNSNSKVPENSETEKGTGTGVFWDKVEMELGQIGRIKISKQINLWKRDGDNNLSFVRILQPGEQLRVFAYNSMYGGQYMVEGNMWVTDMPGYMKYETPSKSLLDRLNAN